MGWSRLIFARTKTSDMPRKQIIIDADLDDLIPGFLASRHADLKALAQAVSRGDAEKIAKIGHTIKGVAGSYGFPDLAAMGEQLQSLAKSGETARCTPIIQRMEDYLSEIEIVFQ
jgi:HPt (histidine-containing phosphotransfer) domain-containing protein